MVNVSTPDNSLPTFGVLVGVRFHDIDLGFSVKLQARYDWIRAKIERSKKQSQHYKGQYGGFYYDRHVGKWRDPDGDICNSCTPENGFPKHGG